MSEQRSMLPASEIYNIEEYIDFWEQHPYVGKYMTRDEIRSSAESGWRSSRVELALKNLCWQ